MTRTRKQRESGMSPAEEAQACVELSEEELDGVTGGYFGYGFGGTYSRGGTSSSTNVIAVPIG